jgi:hypothetical protein
VTGAVKGYAEGRPTGALAVDEAWRIGVDAAPISAVVPGYAVFAYARIPSSPATPCSRTPAPRSVLG